MKKNAYSARVLLSLWSAEHPSCPHYFNSTNWRFLRKSMAFTSLGGRLCKSCMMCLRVQCGINYSLDVPLAASMPPPQDGLWVKDWGWPYIQSMKHIVLLRSEKLPSFWKLPRLCISMTDIRPSPTGPIFSALPLCHAVMLLSLSTGQGASWTHAWHNRLFCGAVLSEVAVLMAAECGWLQGCASPLRTHQAVGSAYMALTARVTQCGLR